MKEQIEKQAIEEMAKDIDGVIEFKILGLNDAFIKVRVACERIAERLYNAGYRKQSEWISVDERLPEKNQIVLCCLGLVMNVYTYMGDGVWEDSYGYFQKDEPISHWMPLPEAPKMKGGAE